jgi:hypothetical protein
LGWLYKKFLARTLEWQLLEWLKIQNGMTSSDFFWQTAERINPTLRPDSTALMHNASLVHHSLGGLMSLTHSITTLLAPESPDRPIVESDEKEALLGNSKRERVLFLTSLLLTSSLVTLALASLPQIFSRSRFLPVPTQQAIQTTPVSLQLKASSQPITQDVQTLTLTVSPASSANVILHINPTSKTKTETIAILHPSAPAALESYSVSVTIQPKLPE